MSQSDRVHVRLIITGHVQGVFYRKSTCDKAKQLGLHGHVKNLNDGAVECDVQGEKKKVDRLINFCMVGPVHARVDNVRVEALAMDSRQFSSFKILDG